MSKPRTAEPEWLPRSFTACGKVVGPNGERCDRGAGHDRENLRHIYTDYRGRFHAVPLTKESESAVQDPEG